MKYPERSNYNKLFPLRQLSVCVCVCVPAAMVSGSNVALQVVRRGRLGVVSVSWATAGLPGNSNGDITPPTGSILLGPQERSSTINLTVRHTPSCVIYFFTFDVYEVLLL